MSAPKDIASYFDSFLSSLLVYAVRLPTSNLSSAFFSEIQMFTPSSQNIIYISPEKNLIDDSDFDIDELSVLFKDVFVNENGIPVVDFVRSEEIINADELSWKPLNVI